jgi:hypothetical protein
MSCRYPPLRLCLTRRSNGRRDVRLPRSVLWRSVPFRLNISVESPDVDVGLDERFVVRPPRTQVGIIFVPMPCRKSFW